MTNIFDTLSKAEIAAIETLEKAGFVLFTDAKIDDVIEARTGARIRARRTWRRAGVYKVVIAKRALEDPAPVAEKQKRPKKVIRDVVPNDHAKDSAPMFKLPEKAKGGIVTSVPGKSKKRGVKK